MQRRPENDEEVRMIWEELEQIIYRPDGALDDMPVSRLRIGIDALLEGWRSRVT